MQSQECSLEQNYVGTISSSKATSNLKILFDPVECGLVARVQFDLVSGVEFDRVGKDDFSPRLLQLS